MNIMEVHKCMCSVTDNKRTTWIYRMYLCPPTGIPVLFFIHTQIKHQVQDTHIDTRTHIHAHTPVHTDYRYGLFHGPPGVLSTGTFQHGGRSFTVIGHSENQGQIPCSDHGVQDTDGNQKGNQSIDQLVSQSIISVLTNEVFGLLINVTCKTIYRLHKSYFNHILLSLSLPPSSSLPLLTW